MCGDELEDLQAQHIGQLDGLIAEVTAMNQALHGRVIIPKKELEDKDTEIARLREALQKIADLPVLDHPTNQGRTEPRSRARRIAICALKA